MQLFPNEILQLEPTHVVPLLTARLRNAFGFNNHQRYLERTKMFLKTMSRLIFIGFTLIYVSLPREGMAGEPQIDSSATIIVHTERLTYSVNQMSGWKADTGKTPDYAASIVFRAPPSIIASKASPTIALYAFNKQDENTQEDLLFDIKKYREHHKSVVENVFNAKNSRYTSYSSSVILDGAEHVYLVYINPGNMYKCGISIVMNTRDRIATESELASYLKIIESIEAIR